MTTHSGTTYRRDNDKNSRVESEQEMSARSSSSPVSDTDSQSDNQHEMHPHYNSPTVLSIVTDRGPQSGKMRYSYSTVVAGALEQPQDDSTSVREVDDGSSHDVDTDYDESDFSEPRLTSHIHMSSPPRLDMKPKFFRVWFEEDSSSGDKRYTFRSEPKHRWSDYSEDDEDLGDIPVDWIKKEPKESVPKLPIILLVARCSSES
ncbi:hypothetical protein K439DRAFT_1622509 [Ramaria rubella]|nr:hypothetical protein K439DRAFT_1622509 [Ramaria rubella]